MSHVSDYKNTCPKVNLFNYIYILMYDPPQMSLLMREVPPSWQSQSPGSSVARILTSSPKAFPPQLIDMGGQVVFFCTAHVQMEKKKDRLCRLIQSDT